MNTMQSANYLFNLNDYKTTFIVWGTPDQGPRSRVFSKKLNIDHLQYISFTGIRGWLIAPFKYVLQAVKTLWVLFRMRPNIIFVQSPPSIAQIFIYLYCRLTDSLYIIDAHSAAFQKYYWTHPRWLYRFLARSAVATIVTNEHFRSMVEKGGGKALIIRDIPTEFEFDQSYRQGSDFTIMVVNTFAKDEPLGEVIKAARALPDVRFFITGKKSSAPPEILKDLPGNVRFTDFLPNKSYYALMRSSHAVVCLTKRDQTMQRGACEALSLGKPIITSNWPILRDYFNKGTIHIDNTSTGIITGINQMKNHLSHFEQGIIELQSQQTDEWELKISQLLELIFQALA